MDRKAIVVLSLSFALLLLWGPLLNHFYPPPPVPPGGTNTVAGAASRSTNEATASAKAAATAPAEFLSAANPSAVPVADTNAPEALVFFENDLARYTFTSHGGGLKQVELKGYPQIVPCGVNKSADPNKLAGLNLRAFVPAMTLLGGSDVQGDGLFTLTKTPTGVRAEKLLTNGLAVVKEFSVTTNYLVAVKVRLENRAAQPLNLPPQEWVVSTATPLNPHDNGLLMGLYWNNGIATTHIDETWFANSGFLSCVTGGSQRRPEYLEGNNDVKWAAVHNQFFTMIVMPKEAAPKLISRHRYLPTPTEKELAADPKLERKPYAFQTAFLYPGRDLQPQQSVERQFDIFAGPKEYNTLVKLGVRTGHSLDDVMNFGGFFGWFAKMLLLSMNKLASFGLSYGWAIVGITVIIKLLFWPLTNASTKSMKRLAALQPQMKAIQEKYKDDPAKGQQKTMEFMRENKVNPLGGCLPMLIQIPVFFGFYTMLQSAIELRGASFLWACDLSQPDTLFVIPGLGLPFNLMPLLMGATQLWQMRLTPPSPGMDPMQQKMMQYMPLMFLFILYNFSTGLTLYWTVQNLLSILQTKLTKTDDAKPSAPPIAPVAPVKKKK